MHACHMDEKNWDEPEEWEPARFLDGGGRFRSAETNKTIAFGAGRRICAGMMQASSIACTSIARFGQKIQSWFVNKIFKIYFGFQAYVLTLTS